MNPNGPHHWLPLPSPTLGLDADPAMKRALGAFLAGPENRLAETAVHWAIGGVPFFADSPETVALSEKVRRHSLTHQEDAERGMKKNGEEKESKTGLKKRSRADALFWQASYPLAPEEDGTSLPIIDYMPMVNIPNLPPLVFYGPSGCGKSHLVRGIYQEFRKRHPKEGGILLAADEFYRSLTEAIARHQTEKFRRFFADCRIVVLEDVDFLENRPVGCEELSALLRRCEESGTLTVLTFANFPDAADGLPKSLRARLIGGLLVPVAFPEGESRRLLFHRYAEGLEVELTPEIEDFMMGSFPKPPGEIFGLFMQSIRLFDWRNGPPGIEKFRDLLNRRQTHLPVSLDVIIKAAADHFDVRVTEMKSPSRLKTVVLARNMAIYLARRLTPMTLTEIGRQFAGRDHSTILHALQIMEERLAEDAELQESYRRILAVLDKKGGLDKLFSL